MAINTYTAADVAAKWSVSTATVKRMARHGALSGSKIGGRWMFTEEQIARYIHENTYQNGVRVATPCNP